jgi:hypothetical protein
MLHGAGEGVAAAGVLATEAVAAVGLLLFHRMCSWAHLQLYSHKLTTPRSLPVLA